MSDYPTAEEELKAQTIRLWAQVEVTEQVIKERDELRTLARELQEALQHAWSYPLTGSWYDQATIALEKARGFEL